MLWLNAAETWIDISSNTADKVFNFKKKFYQNLTKDFNIHE
jgi:hypothetical protein